MECSVLCVDAIFYRAIFPTGMEIKSSVVGSAINTALLTQSKSLIITHDSRYWFDMTGFG